MIDPKVLRIGNWIHCKGSSHYGIVTGDLLALLEKEEKMREKFEYIELTEQIMKAAGYDNQHGEGDGLWIHKDLMGNEDERYKFSLLNIGNTEFELIRRKGRPIRYLHHLQN